MCCKGHQKKGPTWHTCENTSAEHWALTTTVRTPSVATATLFGEEYRFTFSPCHSVASLASSASSCRHRDSPCHRMGSPCRNHSPCHRRDSPSCRSQGSHWPYNHHSSRRQRRQRRQHRRRCPCCRFRFVHPSSGSVGVLSRKAEKREDRSDTTHMTCDSQPGQGLQGP